ncbi:MAG: C-GCAxxG-C-C family protein [Planctomycetota bacterium]
MDRVQKATQLFNSNFICSQSVLAAFADKFGMDESDALKVASGFGGGIGCSGGACGALTGAVMVLGLCCCTTDPADKTTKIGLYRKVRQLTEEYKLRTGSTICRELMGFDMSTPEGDKMSKMPGAFDRCDDFVRIAAEILEEMLNMQEREDNTLR